MPGYAGYVPHFQTEYPSNKDVPAHKYEDIDIQQTPLMHHSTWKSNAQVSHTHPSQARSVPCVLPEGSKYARGRDLRTKTVAARDLHEYEKRPTAHWGTTYGNSHDGWNSHNKASPPEQTLDFNNGPKQILTSRDIPTSYQRSFGTEGSNPRDRYVYGDGKQVFSRRATTRDLFMGTNKGSARIPGYAGYVPGSINNMRTIRQNVPYDTKAHIIQTYDHNVPGYTGHHPSSVTNDKGPRIPESKCQPAVGLHTGMMTGSMRSQ